MHSNFIEKLGVLSRVQRTLFANKVQAEDEVEIKVDKVDKRLTGPIDRYCNGSWLIEPGFRH